jgi:selenide,water dikinase
MPADLVLVGGGHAHVQVIRRFMMEPAAGVRLTVVLDRPEAVYSGMVPGFVAGDYAAEALEIDVVPLARRAGARVVLAAATALDPAAKTIALEGRPALGYDVASLDVGSTVRALDLPGVREHALATRPIRGFVDRLDAAVAAARERSAGEKLRVAVVGGGAAGVELAFTLEARLRAAGVPVELAIVADTDALLPGSSGRLARDAAAEARRRGIRLRLGARVSRVEAHGLELVGEAEPEPADLVLWATGAAPVPLLAAVAAPKDAQGFLRVLDTFQCLGADDLFAAGDCAALDAYPWLPKAGVYAVRAGPVLDANLRARLAGETLRRYRPQRDFLALLNLGDGRALGGKWGMTLSGRTVWRLKDRIDRGFVARFRALDFPPMAGEPMACGGCAAKLDAGALAAALAALPPAPRDESVLVGLERPDDAAVLRTPSGDTVIATADGFRAFCDDPWLVGRAAAVSALSDVYAKGGRPRHALAWVTLPEGEGARAGAMLAQVMAGVRAALDPLGVSLVGGHTTTGAELQVGLAVTGALAPGERWLGQGGLRPGDRLILTKPLGTGVVLAADMQGRARGAWVQAAHAHLLRANDAAARLARRYGALACTDVSGFGLAQHLGALLSASGAGAVLDLAALPALPGARELLAAGVRSTFHAQNVAAAAGLCEAAALEARPGGALLFDPQTSGGLLFGVAAGGAAVAVLHDAGELGAAVIGEVVAGPPRIEFTGRAAAPARASRSCRPSGGAR